MFLLILERSTRLCILSIVSSSVSLASLRYLYLLRPLVLLLNLNSLVVPEIYFGVVYATLMSSAFPSPHLGYLLLSYKSH